MSGTRICRVLRKNSLQTSSICPACHGYGTSTSMSVFFDEGKFLAPVDTWGKYEAEGDKVLVPLSMNIHHSVADGFHLSRFFNKAQEVIDLFAHQLLK